MYSILFPYSRFFLCSLVFPFSCLVFKLPLISLLSCLAAPHYFPSFPTLLYPHSVCPCPSLPHTWRKFLCPGKVSGFSSSWLLFEESREKIPSALLTLFYLQSSQPVSLVCFPISLASISAVATSNTS